MGKRKKGDKIHGWFVLNKEEGNSSAKDLAIVKRLFNAQKAGHGGTLDPLACGVLPIAFGEATKTVSYVMDGRKTYEFTITFGYNTTTIDKEGQATEHSDIIPTEEQITSILSNFIGDIAQVPPIFSAIKVNGKRAYDLARSGETVKLQARNVKIYHLDLLKINNNQATFIVDCGKGTYVRSLARDIIHDLNTCGHVSLLKRTKVGKFSLKDSFTIANLEKIRHNDNLKNVLIDITTVLDDILALAVNDNMANKIANGLRINHKRIADLELHEDGTRILILNKDLANKPVAIAQFMNDEIKSIRGFSF